MLEDHFRHLLEVFEILKAQKFFCHLYKCYFSDTHMKYLDHPILEKGVSPDMSKVGKVKEWPRPIIV